MECFKHNRRPTCRTSDRSTPYSAMQASGAGAINIELFAKVPGNIAMLLRLLEDPSPAMQDFYVRYFIVQLLTLLAFGNSYRLQQASNVWWHCVERAPQAAHLSNGSCSAHVLSKSLAGAAQVPNHSSSAAGCCLQQSWGAGTRVLSCVSTSQAVANAEPAGQALLAAPLGVVRLTDLIGDPRPALRNEALLLLVGLSRSNPDIQRLAAFEGAFDRLLTIVRSAWCLSIAMQPRATSVA